MAGFCESFFILLLKNFKIKLRNKNQLILEILWPICFVLLLALIRISAIYRKEGPQWCFDSSDLNEQVYVDVKSWKKLEVGYYPDSTCTKEIAIAGDLSLKRYDSHDFLREIRWVGFNDTSSWKKLLENNELMAGIEFDAKFHNAQECPLNVSYKLRVPSKARLFAGGFNIPFQVEGHFATQSLYLPEDHNTLRMSGLRRFIRSKNAATDLYNGEDILGFPQAIFDYVYHKYCPSDIYNSYDTYLQGTIIKCGFHEIEFTSDVLKRGFEAFTSFIILLSFLYPSLSTVKNIINGKTNETKMLISTLNSHSNLADWMAWLLIHIIILIPNVIYIILILKSEWNLTMGETTNYVRIIEYTDWTVLLVLLSSYCLSVVTFFAIFATIFSNVYLAILISSVIWLSTYMPFEFFQYHYSFMTLYKRILLSSFPNTGMAFAFKIIFLHDVYEKHLTINTIFKPFNIDEKLSVGDIVITLLTVSILFLIIAMFIEFIIVYRLSCNCFENGIKKNTKKQWALSIKNLKTKSNDESDEGITFNLEAREVLVMMGNNGSHKTVLMQTIFGLIKPLNGTVIVNNFDIKTHLSQARSVMGFCSEKNILFDELSVKEHLILFSKLKGTDPAHQENELNNFIKVLDMQKYQHTMSKNLSYCEKRKLSIALAFCGKSKIVLCDEPFAGISPVAKSKMYDIFELEKLRERTILIATHSKADADIIADKIGLIENGKLRTFGTPSCLIKKLGIGHILTITKGENCKPQEVTNFLRGYIPEIIWKTNTREKLSYEIAAEDSDKVLSVIPYLKKQLDLNIKSYSFNHITLENHIITPFLKTDNSKQNCCEIPDGNEFF